MPRFKNSTAKALADAKLKIEQAKLAKLEDSLPKPKPEYTSYEDLPPLDPADTIKLHNRFNHLARCTEADRDGRKIKAAEEEWHMMNQWMKGIRIGMPPDYKPSLPFWQGITVSGRSLFDGDRLCEAFIEACFGDEETRAADVKRYHENLAIEALGNFLPRS